MKNNYIDSHIHHYPQEIAIDPVLWAEDKGELLCAELFKSPLQAWSTTEELLQHMDRADVERVVLQGMYWRTQDACRFHNDFYLKCIESQPDRFIAFASIQPLSGVKGLDSLKFFADKGFKGIGEIFPQAQGFGMQDPSWLNIVEWAINQNFPICMHVTDPVGHAYKGRIETNLADYQWLAERYPELKLILAHFGGGLFFYELNSFCKKAFKNVYYDTAASPLLYDKKVYQIAKEIVGVDKILFGTDYPLRTFPQSQDKPDFIKHRDQIVNSCLDAAEKEKVFYKNIAGLLAL